MNKFELLQSGVVFTGTNHFGLIIKVWRSKCRHYKIKREGQLVERVTKDRAQQEIVFSGLEPIKAIPTLPTGVTPKNALQALWEALKVKIEACYKALSILPKLYKDKATRYTKENSIWVRLSSLSAYKANLLNLKYKG